ncbi:hypothetical protein F4810DRAFT_709528 [Camillea tinctor]|nr:hypothetical protein F4810DRAFT_709528 [Camillea tinctor]
MTSDDKPRLISARAIAAFSDAELDQYLEEHCLRGGIVTVEVEDPENLPPSFIQRLRDRANRPSSPRQSRAVDADQLAARLLEISSSSSSRWDPRPVRPPSVRSPSEHSDGYRPGSGRRTPSASPDHEERRVREYHDLLVKQGGRPIYSVDLIDEISQHPLSHWDLLRPWVDYPPDYDPEPNEEATIRGITCAGTSIIQQLISWKEFREWQRYIRKDGHGFDSTYTRVPGEGHTYADYNEAIKALLAEHDFTRPFRLQKDPMHQDKLTTWIEYLAFEYRQHDLCIQSIQSVQPEYDKYWKILVDSNVLRPFETKELIHSGSRYGLLIERDREKATRVVESAERIAQEVAESMDKDAHNPKGSRFTSQQREQKILTAKSKLDAAKESLALVEKRNRLVIEFLRTVRQQILPPFGYDHKRMEAMGHSLRIPWILSQVPLIEAESNERDADDEAAHDRDIQRRDTSTSDPLLPCEAGSGHQSGKLKRSREDAADGEQPSKQVRDGGRGLASPVRISNSANTGLTKGQQESGTSTVRRGSGKKRAGKTAGSLIPEESKPFNDHLQGVRKTKNTRQSSTTAQLLRRSSRIAARQAAARQATAQTIVARSDAAESPPRRSLRRSSRRNMPKGQGNIKKDRRDRR